jgi:hypothetical protein
MVTLSPGVFHPAVTFFQAILEKQYFPIKSGYHI